MGGHDSQGRRLKWSERYDRDAIQTIINGLACEAYPYGGLVEGWHAVPREGRFFKATASSPEAAFERLRETLTRFYGRG